jgi:phosphoglucosamine mutase
MGQLFGTDGIRGVAGEPPLDADTVFRIGASVTEYLRRLDATPIILIGRDTRVSGPWLEALLEAAIAAAGGTPRSCGVLATPAVSVLTTRTGAQAGIVISASHNPYQDNGIKIFASTGIKFTDAVEEELEARIAASRLSAPPELALRQPDGRDEALPGHAAPFAHALLEEATEFEVLYREYLTGTLPADFRLDGVRLVVDCGHGSQSLFAPDFLRSLGADVQAIHSQPDGYNINRNAGALHVEALQAAVKARGADLGIAFDGDADRAIFVDLKGTVRDGDDVLYLFARHLDFRGAPRIIVGTVMANLGLELALGELGFRLVRTGVGDRYVLEEMMRSGAIVGGEQSGHVILTRLGRTGDGLLTALQVLAVLRATGRGIAEICAPLARLPQVLVNVRVIEKVPFASIPGLGEAERACRAELGPRSRVLLRYSGTERLARVMVEGEDAGKVRAAADRLAAAFGSISAAAD